MSVELVREKACCFTGHRDLSGANLPVLQKQIRDEVARLWEQGTDIFLAGGALGFDTVAAQEVMHLKPVFGPGLKLVLVLPYLGQEMKWDPMQQARYHYIMRKADEVIYTGDVYGKGLLFRRDRYLVDNSSHCIAYLLGNRTRGGTLYTVRYAQRQGLGVTNLALPVNHNQLTLFDAEAYSPLT